MTSIRRNSAAIGASNAIAPSARTTSPRKKKKKGILSQRKSLRSNGKKLVKSRRTASVSVSFSGFYTREEAIVAKLADIYARTAVEVPCLAVSDIHLFLAHIFIAENQPLKAVGHSLKYLESMGYIIKGGRIPQNSPGTPLVVKRWGLMMDGNFESWMALSKAYSFVAADLAVQAREYAKSFAGFVFDEDETLEETCAR